MAEILTTRRSEKGVIFEIEASLEEAKITQGNFKDILLFCELTSNHKEMSISSRGELKQTRYFLIPRELRENIIYGSKIKCQSMETENNLIVIYMVPRINKNDKEMMKNSKF